MLGVAAGRSQGAAEGLLVDAIQVTQREAIEPVCIGMSPAFAAAVFARLPRRASSTIRFTCSVTPTRRSTRSAASSIGSISVTENRRSRVAANSDSTASSGSTGDGLGCCANCSSSLT
jgi:hypothetical protein